MSNTLENLNSVNEMRSQSAFNMGVDDWTASQWGNAIAGETGELCNWIKKMERGDFNDDPEYVIKQIGKEAADIIIIYLDLLCKKLGLYLPEQVKNKFNEVSIKKEVDIFI